MKEYRLFHRELKKFWDGEANSAQEACQKAGWLIGDTWVRERTQVVSNSASDSGHTGGGLRDITHRIKQQK